VVPPHARRGTRACAGNGLRGTLVQQQAAAPALGADVSPLALSVDNVDSRTLRVRIGAEGRWEVPRALLLGSADSAPAPARSPSHAHSVQSETDILMLWGARSGEPAATAVACRLSACTPC
jgi:hypothetical protein